MCAVNPKFHFRVTLDFYASPVDTIAKDDFARKVMEKVLQAEMDINTDGSIRCHTSNPEEVTK